LSGHVRDPAFVAQPVSYNYGRPDQRVNSPSDVARSQICIVLGYSLRKRLVAIELERT